MTAESMRSQLLQILQPSLSERPGEPVSFVAIGKALGISRQYVRKLYHELKTEYPVPPVGKRGFGANNRHG
jgi:biotin operon repressor